MSRIDARSLTYRRVSQALSAKQVLISSTAVLISDVCTMSESHATSGTSGRHAATTWPFSHLTGAHHPRDGAMSTADTAAGGLGVIDQAAPVRGAEGTTR